MECLVNILWDNETSIWIATSDDIPGLVLESDSYDTLIEKVNNAIPELLKLNNIQNVTSVYFRSEKHQEIHVND